MKSIDTAMMNGAEPDSLPHFIAMSQQLAEHTVDGRVLLGGEEMSGLYGLFQQGFHGDIPEEERKGMVEAIGVHHQNTHPNSNLEDLEDAWRANKGMPRTEA